MFPDSPGIKAIVCIAFILIFPTELLAQNTSKGEKIAKLADEIAALLYHGNDTTEVSIEQCTLQITTRVRETCSYPTEPNISQVTIYLNEVEEMEFWPGRERQILNIELIVPKPAFFETWWNRTTKGDKVALEEYMIESERLLIESEIRSRDTSISCTGLKFEKIQPSILLILEAKPRFWSEMQKLISTCR